MQSVRDSSGKVLTCSSRREARGVEGSLLMSRGDWNVFLPRKSLKKIKIIFKGQSSESLILPLGPSALYELLGVFLVLKTISRQERLRGKQRQFRTIFSPWLPRCFTEEDNIIPIEDIIRLRHGKVRNFPKVIQRTIIRLWNMT